MEGYCVKENLWRSAIVALIKLKIQLEDTTWKKKNWKKLFVINSKDKVGYSPFYLYRPPYELVMRIWYYIKVRCVSVFSPLILLDNVLNLWGKVRSLRLKTATGLTKWRSKSFNIFFKEDILPYDLQTVFGRGKQKNNSDLCTFPHCVFRAF